MGERGRHAMKAQTSKAPITTNHRMPLQALIAGRALPNQSKPTEAFAIVTTKARQRPAKRGIRGVGRGRRSKTSQALPRASRVSRRDRKTYRKKYSAMTSAKEAIHRNSQADLSRSEEVLALCVK
jgi:hypothetical protein